LLDAAFVDLPTLLEEAHQSGNLAIPFVRQLTAAVWLRSEDAARSVHWGATSQDLLDTALVLQMREALALISEDLERLDRQLLQRVEEHAHTVMAGRTWLQQGPPITLGLKIAGWLAAIRRHRERLQAASERALVLQFGGAVGTLAALGEKGTAVSAHLARTLGLTEPDLPWHTHRDNLVEVATVLGLLAGTLGKIARDVSLLMETEVAEVSEPWTEGRGGSSTMPHKRNPVASAIVLAAAARIPGLVSTLLTAMVQEHERGLGGWHAEWETLPEVFFLASAALARVLEIAGGLDVHAARMLANLEQTQGLAMSEAVSIALAADIGRARAHELVEEASRRTIAEGRPLRDVLKEIPQICQHLSEADIDRILDPRNYLGSAQSFIERIIRGENDSN
jgi:3-carboxy-cis,cis-muconate cycloisomerase